MNTNYCVLCSSFQTIHLSFLNYITGRKPPISNHTPIHTNPHTPIHTPIHTKHTPIHTHPPFTLINQIKIDQSQCLKSAVIGYTYYLPLQ